MTDSSTSRRRFLALGGAALASSLAGCGASAPAIEDSDASDSTTSETTTSAGGTSTPAGNASASDLRGVYNDVYRNAIDSVVMVQAGQSRGTGFLFDDTHVVTNAHVVGQATTTDVRFSAGMWSRGEVVGTDPHSDLAAVEVEEQPPGVGPLSFADTNPVVGQQVVAIGNPYDLRGSATTGIVSGVDRSIQAPTGYSIPDAIQTDAALNPGNSGGPLMSLDGEVVAVVNSGGGENIGFGISAALTKRVVPALIENGEFEHSYVGVALANVTPTVAEANDLGEPRGLLVMRVAPGSPADGVFQGSETEFVDGRRTPVGGDVLLAVDGRKLRTNEDLGSYLALETRPGDTVTFTVLSDGTRETVDLELSARPENTGV